MRKEMTASGKYLDNHWYAAVVQEGNRLGRTIGFPTINLDPAILCHGQPNGTYVATVAYAGKLYAGALYVGPRLVINETRRVLEIYILAFDQTIYGQPVQFQLNSYIRGVMHFSSLEMLKQQLETDCLAVTAWHARNRHAIAYPVDLRLSAPSP